MPSNFVRHLMPIIATVILGTFAPRTDAKELLVFISAFASGDEGAIHAYQLDLATGQLKLVQRTTGVENPFFLALSPDRKFLYSIHAPGAFGGKSHEQVAAYELVGRTGGLKFLNRQSTRGSSSCYLAVDATGKTVVVANYATGSVASLPVQQDGSLGEIVSFVQHEGSSVNPKRQEGPHAHCAVISPDNRFVYAADLGIDRVMAYRSSPWHCRARHRGTAWARQCQDRRARWPVDRCRGVLRLRCRRPGSPRPSASAPRRGGVGLTRAGQSGRNPVGGLLMKPDDAAAIAHEGEHGVRNFAAQQERRCWQLS